MYSKSLKWIFTGILAVVMVTTAQAGESQEAYTGLHLDQQPHEHYNNDALDWFHNPADGLTMTLDTRLRYVYGWNVYMSDSTGGQLDYGRFRNRWGQKLQLDENTSINSRLVWEFRTWDEPSSKTQSVDFDEIIFDRLNIKIDNFLDLPVTATIGRQDLIYGTGWLILDGTPLDGSRTIFQDAAKFSWAVDDDTTADLILVSNHASSNKWLKPINSRDRFLTEQDEEAVILYVTDKSIENTQLEGYFIYKNDEAVSSAPWTQNAEIYTLGAAIQQKVTDNWSYRCEGALQFGDKDGQSLRAFGTKNKLTYSFNDKYNNQLHAEYEYLSGDDESTSSNEQFDPLWGEWPQWSELYVYSYVSETAIGETTNLHRVALSHNFNPYKAVRFKTAYNLLWAAQDNLSSTGSATQQAMFNGGHTFRGQLFTAWLTYSCCKNVKAHLVGEYFMPGNYYADANRGHATFIRANLEYTW